MFQENEGLVHLDLSHNGLTVKTCEVAAPGLNENRSILGLHMRGNQAISDAQGFLRIDEDAKEHDIAIHHYSRLPIHLQTASIRNSKVLELKPTAHCWICEGWTPVSFTWQSASRLDETVPVYLHLEVDKYEGDLMERSRSDQLKYSLTRMLPPGPQRYYYSVDDTPCIDPSAPQLANDLTLEDLQRQFQERGLDPEGEGFEEKKEKIMQQRKALLGERKNATPPRKTARAVAGEPPEKVKKILIPVTNYIANVVQTQSLVGSSWPAETVPRPRARMMIRKKRARTPWDFAKSVFAEYKPDTEVRKRVSQDLLDQCFQFDWSQSKLEKIIRSEEQASFVKLYLRSVYRPIRDSYKFFSAVQPSNGIFSIGTNVFNEIVSSLGVVDKITLKLSDVDLDFVATNAGVPKRPGKNLNPERQLVRHQFMEIWVRLALSKFFKTKQTREQSEAVRRFFQDHALSFMEPYDSHRFRIERLWCENCDRIFKLYMPVVKGLYDKYSGRYSLPGQAPFMSLEEFTQLVTDSNVIDENFGAREVGMLFSVSMMTQVNELDSDRHLHMQFPEFIEAIARLAHKLALASQSNIEFEYSQDSDAEQEATMAKGKPLYQKLEDALKIFSANCLGLDFTENFQKNFKTLGFKFHQSEGAAS